MKRLLYADLLPRKMWAFCPIFQWAILRVYEQAKSNSSSCSKRSCSLHSDCPRQDIRQIYSSYIFFIQFFRLLRRIQVPKQTTKREVQMKVSLLMIERPKRKKKLVWTCHIINWLTLLDSWKWGKTFLKVNHVIVLTLLKAFALLCLGLLRMQNWKLGNWKMMIFNFWGIGS